VSAPSPAAMEKPNKAKPHACADECKEFAGAPCHVVSPVKASPMAMPVDA
jgi:hypothetical protein